MSDRLLVAASIEAGSNVANAVNTIKMAEGFSTLGFNVTIACRAAVSGRMPEEKLRDLYGVKERIRWVQLPQNIFGRALNAHGDFAAQLIPSLLKTRPDLVFSRSYIAPWLTTKLGIPTIAESHAHPDNATKPFMRFVRGTNSKSFLRLITISKILADHYAALGVPQTKIKVLPDAVDTSLFHPKTTTDASPFEGPGPHIVYTGHLYDYKGIPTVLETAKLCPDLQFHLVGGRDEDIQRHRKQALNLELKNVCFHGTKPHASMPIFARNADVLLLPPSATHPSAHWTSPVKLGEYLASGVPVVVSSIPALKVWLDDDVCWFFEPDNAQDLKRAILSALSDESASYRTRTGLTLADDWTYHKRAARILDGIS